jgi:hypothetical protein
VNASCSTCGSTTYWDGSTCATCPAGSYCQGYVSSVCTGAQICGAGYYSTSGLSACTACSRGYECPTSAMTAQTQCTAGKYTSSTAQSACLDCAAGYACPSTNTISDRTACASGTYSLSGENVCTACPTGYYCPSTTATTTTVCASGTYSTGSQSSCTTCAAGTYCTSTTAAGVACPAGKYSNSGSTSCTSVPVGYYAASSGTATASICTSGYYCPVVGLTAQIACSAGRYTTSSGSTVCTDCSGGYRCPSLTTDSDKVACASGTFSVGASDTCTSCPAGYYCSSTTSARMTPCSAGYYSLGGAASCTQCPQGSSCSTKNASPVKCPRGTYSSDGAVVCTPVPAGYYSSVEGTSSYAQCTAGTYSTGGASVCTDCSPGYLCAVGSTSPTPIASACAIGGYCSAATSWVYTACPTGSYGITAAGQSESHACKYCEPGYYCPSTGTTKATRTACPAGAYCPMGSTTPTYCPAGYYSANPSQQSIGTCIVCPAGTYCINAGSTAPVACPAYYYCPEGTSDYITYPCPGGTFSETTGRWLSSQCTNCTEGYFCPGDNSPQPCPAGRWNQYQGIDSMHDCDRCSPGYACPSTGMTETTSVPCGAGYYCPAGTSAATQYGCPAGRYSDSTTLTSKESCTLTEAGYTTVAASSSSNRVPCLAGHYCPIGTAGGADVDCPAGKYLSATQSTQLADCTQCPERYYCIGGGATTTGDCPAGHYCPAGTTTATQYPCPAGFYSSVTGLAGALECTDAKEGWYAIEGSTTATKCPAGRYTSVNNTEYYEAVSGAAIVCNECTAGSYCPEGCTAPIACGVGYYSNVSVEVCSICPLGNYCGSNTSTLAQITGSGGSWDNTADLAGICFPGTLCDELGYSRRPELTNDACPTGYYCPAGTTAAIPCAAGTYNPNTGGQNASACLTTDAGYYSVAASTAKNGLCYPGYYCPEKSSGPMAAACLAGTYRAEYGGTASSDCATCTAGSYCPKASYAPLLCPRGYYCPASTAEPIACGPGTFGDVAGLRQESECTLCSPGYYCETWALQAPTGLCTAGYFCVGGTNTSTPQRGYGAGNWTSGVCPRGYYCDMGSATPAACPVGSFNENEGGISSSACTSCTAGQYCEGLANIYPTGYCTAGYYCTGGASTPTQYITQPGYHTPTGSSAQQPCLSGNYQSASTQSSCVTCPAGYYCAYDTMTNYTSYPCPAGAYCPAGSANPTNCAIGKFSATAGNIQVADCIDCTAGSYCATAGLTAPTGLCDPAYYCTGAAIAATQEVDTSTGGRCTVGHYCPQGTGSPMACPSGQYMATIKNTGVNNFLDKDGNAHTYVCTPCDNSRVCTTTGLSASNADCPAGYWCNLGAKSSTAPDCVDANCTSLYDVCPAYHYCPAGNNSVPIGCPAGTYNNAIGQTSCGTCQAGYYCTGGGNAPVICPAGSYCPAGTSSANEYVCPIGTYSTNTGLTQVSQCDQCAAGMYCPTLGSGVPAGNCSAGHFCGGGSSTATPADSDGYHISYVGDTCVVATNASTNDVCPAGHYCPEGSSAPKPCAAGRYGFSAGQDDITDCSTCPGGMYCPVTGMTNATRSCPGGYYCPAGSSDYSLQCDPGYSCPAGSASPTVCNAGTFQNSSGALSCHNCPAGYYCPTGAVTATVCPVGSYCNALAETPAMCFNGTYGNSTGLTLQSDCFECDTSRFCNGGLLRGTCAAGYFCKSRSPSATPDRNITKYNNSLINQMYYLKSLDYAQCPPNHYCLEGTTDPVMCPNGTVYQYTHATSIDNCGPCPAGTYCVDGSPTPELCPVGYYCPYGQGQVGCPVTTYGASVGLESAGQCTTCPAGYACNSTGISNYALWPCPAGYYCPNVTQTASPCPGGTYLPTTGASLASECITCPQYHYCPAGSSAVLLCPEGSYCPVNSEYATLCPPGTYCPSNSTTPTTCPATYYCPGAQGSPLPCFLGTYCPDGTANPMACPLGYIQIASVNGTISHLGTLDTACEMCAAGKYGNDPNRLLCYPGIEGYVYYGGTTGPYPANVTSDRGEPCPAGYYCPTNSSVATACPVGKYNSLTKQTSVASCTNCAAGTYAFSIGTAGCTKCSTSSTSSAGSSACTCVGNNRAFQPASGYCICNPGYEFVDTDFSVSSEEDGDVDCQPIVYDRCATGDTRNYLGQCVDSATSCYNLCGTDGGTISSTTGICECKTLKHIDDICDSTCRAAATTTICDASGNMVVTYSSGATETIAASSYVPSSGSVSCAVSGASILNMDASAGTFTGIFGAPASVTAQAVRRRLMYEPESNTFYNDGYYMGEGYNTPSSITTFSNSSRFLSNDSFSRRLEDEISSRRLADASVSNPAVCVKVGDSVVWSTTSTSYPVYMKDSLLNSNPDFDYSAFRELAEQASSSTSVTTFAYTFLTAGDYVFQISSSSTALTIISVINSDLTCGVTTTYDTISGSTLVSLGVSNDGFSIVLGPDWPLLIGLIFGMLAVVLLIVGSLYYFRKKSWVHAQIKRRAPGPNSGIDPSKGGQYGNKVVPTNYDEEKDGGDLADDVLKAMEAQDRADVTFDQDMLIPELAKLVQQLHDDEAAKLTTNKELVEKMEDTLKKEVDDMKALLNATAMQMSSAGGSEAVKVKKLRQLLEEVKKNVGDRQAFSGNLGMDETAFMNIIEGLQRLLREGSSETARVITEEMSEDAVKAHEEESDKEKFDSDLLKAIIVDLQEISNIHNTQSTVISEEARKVAIDDKAFEDGLNQARVAFPGHIREMMQTASEIMVDENGKHAEVHRLLATFAERVPRFTFAIDSAQGIFGRAAKSHIESGNKSAFDDTKITTKNELTSYLNDLLAALVLIQEKITSRMEESAGIRDVAHELRSNLIAAIENELGYLPSDNNGDLAKQLAPLLAQMKGGDFPMIPSDDDRTDEESEEDGPTPMKSAKKSMKMKSSKSSKTEIEEDAIDDIMENDDLTLEQKGELLQKAENDAILADQIRQRELAQKEEHIEQVKQEMMNNNTAEDEEDDLALLQNNKDELDALKNEMESAHNDKLEAMDRCEYMANLDTDSAHDTRVATLAVNRYVCALRTLTLETRLKYFENETSMMKKRATAAQSVLKKYGQQARAGSTESMTLSMSTLDELEQALDQCDVEQENSVQGLMQSVDSEFKKAIAFEDHLRKTWMKNPQSVDIDAEVIRLRKECNDKIRTVRENYSIAEKDYMSSVTADIEINDAVLSIKREADHIDDKKHQELVDALKKEEELVKETAQKDLAENSRIIDNQEYNLGHVLNLCDVWGPKVDVAEHLRVLFERLISDEQIRQDIISRLTLEETRARQVIETIRVESELNKRFAEKAEVELVLQNLNDAAKENFVILAKNLDTDGKANVEREEERQKEAVPDYEYERAMAVQKELAGLTILKLRLAQSKRKLASEIRESLNVKRDNLLVQSNELAMSDEVLELSKKQVHEEVLREESQLKSQFVLLQGESYVMMRLSSEVTSGITPSVEWADSDMQQFHQQEICTMRESLVHETARQTFKRQFENSKFKELEQMRIMALNRSGDELEKIYGHLDDQLQESLSQIDVDYNVDAKRLDERVRDQMAEKIKVHHNFHDEVYVITSDRDTALTECTTLYEGKISETEANTEGSEELKLKAVIAVRQEYAAKIDTIYCDAETRVFKAFQNYHWKTHTLEKVEDDLVQLRNSLINKKEAEQNALENEKYAKYRDLIQGQINARNKARKLKDDYDMEVNGLDEVMKAKKAKQAQFLKDRLARRKKKRVEDLVKEGMSEKEAQQVVAQEMEHLQEQQSKQLDEAIEKETAMKRKEIRSDGDDLENNVMDAYKNALAMSEDGLADAKRRQKEALEARLRNKKKNRVKELMDGGMSEADAEKQAAQELKEEAIDGMNDIDQKLKDALSAGEGAVDKLGKDLEEGMMDKLHQEIANIKNDKSLSEDQKRAAIKAAEDDFNKEMERIRNQEQLAKDILENGLDATKDKNRKSLADRLAKRTKKRVNELMKTQGMSESDAKKQAAKEASVEDPLETEQAENDVKLADQMLKTAIEDNLKDKLTQIKCAQEEKLKGLENSLGAKQSAMEKNLKDRLARRKGLRKAQLQAAGKSEDEIVREIEGEFDKAEDAAEGDAIAARLASEAQAAKDLKEKALKEMEATESLEGGAKGVEEDADVVKFLNGAAGQELEAKKNLDLQARKAYDAAADAAKSGANQTDDELRNLRAEHEAAVDKLQGDMDAKRALEENALKKKLEARRKRHKKDLQEINKHKLDPNASPGETKEAIEEIAKVMEDNLKGELQDTIDAINADSSLTADQKQAAIKQAQDDWNAEKERIKLEEETAASILTDGLEHTHNMQKGSMAERLAKRRKERESDLKSKGLSNSEVQDQLQREMEIETSKEESALAENIAHAKELLESTTGPKLSDKDIDKKNDSDMKEDEEMLRKQQELDLKIEEEKALAELNRKNQELEKMVIERERAAAEAAAQKANDQENEAKKKLEALRKEQEEETKKLNAANAAERKNGEKNLKDKLAARRAARMKKLDDSKASDEAKAAEEARMKQEEHDAMLQLEAQEQQEEAVRREELERKQRQAEEDAKKQVEEAQLEAQVAATRAAALEAVKESQERAEKEANERELNRLKNLQNEHATKANTDLENRRKSKKANLANRLKAKRAKREQELADKETKRLAELAATQAADAEKREELRQAKMGWQDRLNEATTKANESGLTGREKEDYLIKELLGNKLVPAEHMSQAIGTILSERHANETANLVAENYDARIAAIQSVHDTLTEEKATARSDLLTQLNDEGADQSVITEKSNALDEKFKEKGLAEEQKAVSVLDQEAMRKQMTLRQSQMSEISSIITAHSDPETLKQLQEASGKSAVEEMAEYRAKLEKDRQEREASMKAEREAEEARMKQEMEAEMTRMKQRLAQEQAEAESEFAKKKAQMEKEMAKQKEAMLAKQNETNNKVDKEEQARIQKDFDKAQQAQMKELEEAKAKKKSKLAERLARKKKVKSAPAMPSDAPPADLAGAASVAQSGTPRKEDGSISGEGDKEPVTKEIKKGKEKWQEQLNQVKELKKKQQQITGDSGASSEAMSALEVKLDRIEGLLSNLSSITPSSGDNSTAIATSSGPKSTVPTYIDDHEPASGEKLALIPDTDLHVQQRSRLEFGRKLASMLNMNNINVAAASSLPPLVGNGGSNPFMRSYRYDSNSKLLTIHTNRLDSSGEFGAVIMHALAHIKVNPSDISDDQDPAFVKEFYKNLQTLSQDAYRHSSDDLINEATGSGSTNTSKGKGSNKGSRLLKLTGSLRTDELADKLKPLVNDNDIDTETYFNKESMTSRMREYAQSSGGAVPLDFLDRYEKEKA